MIEQFFPNRQEASLAAADVVAEAIRKRLHSENEVALVVSGGSTPAPCLQDLSTKALNWSKVHVLPSDERWVPATDANSNENMIRSALIKNCAANAMFVPLYRTGKSVEAGCAAVNATLKHLPLPLAATLLGMGEDGHFASLFPDLAGLEIALDPGNENWCLPVITKASPHPRISLTLASLTCSDEVLLLFFGEEKLQVFEKVKSGELNLPISAVLQQDRTPVRVIWAP